MRLPANRIIAVTAILALCAGYASPQTTANPHPSAKSHAHSSKLKSTKGKSRGPKKGAWKHHGQQTIQADRAREIQEALIRENYLTGEPSGQWDARTKDAMTRYQADHGWQTKVTPDSRALIKLGLGPNYTDNILNPKPASDAVAANGAGATTSKQQ